MGFPGRSRVREQKCFRPRSWSLDIPAPFLPPRPFRAPWAPTLSSSSFRRWGETSVQLSGGSPPSGCELPLRLQRRAQPLLRSSASWGQDGVRGRSPGAGGRKGERPRLTRAFAGGAGASPQSACCRLPSSHGSLPKTEIGELAGGRLTLRSFIPGTGEGGRG